MARNFFIHSADGRSTACGQGQIISFVSIGEVKQPPSQTSQETIHLK